MATAWRWLAIMKHGMVRRAIVESQGRRKVAADEAKVITDQLSKLKKSL